MIYPISDELELSIQKVEEKEKLASTFKEVIIVFELKFLKHKFQDAYSIQFLDFESYVKKSIEKNQKNYHFFFQHDLSATFFFKGDIEQKSIDLVCENLREDIIKYYDYPLLLEDMNEDLMRAIESGEPYSERITQPIRDLSLKIDNIMLYKGDYLENLSYLIMRDYMDRDQVTTNLLYAYEISADNERSLITNLDDFVPKQDDFCEIYIFAKVSFKKSVQNAPLPIYIGITFITLAKFLEDSDNFLSRLGLIPQVYTLRKFFAAKIYDYPKIEELIKRVISTLAEAVPAGFLAERLKKSFDVYSANPLQHS